MKQNLINEPTPWLFALLGVVLLTVFVFGASYFGSCGWMGGVR